MSREETKQKLEKLIDPLITALGFELVQLEYVTGKYGKLQLCIDHLKGVLVEDCAMISSAVSDLLDREDPINHSYNLEVSSPGLERPLTKIEHYMRFKGDKVKVRVKEEVTGEKNFCGILENAHPDHIVIEREDGAKIEVLYENIARANLWYTGPEKNALMKNRAKGGGFKQNE
jgi:ribosome maturation factor RimP